MIPSDILEFLRELGDHVAETSELIKNPNITLDDLGALEECLALNAQTLRVLKRKVLLRDKTLPHRPSH